MKRKKMEQQQAGGAARVVLIEDDSTIREGIGYLIDSTEGYCVAGQYDSVNDAMAGLADDNPDVILLDVELPGMNGVDAIPKIKKLLPDVYIIILTVYENEQTIFRALGNGAAGYLTKNTPSSKIIEAVKEVIEGGGPMSAGIAGMVIKSFYKNTSTPLSKRETEILQAVSEGKSRGKIAKELFIDLETVKTHIKNIYHKLNVNSKEEALKVAKQSRFI